METKHFVYFGATIGGLIGSWVGSMLDNGNFLGIWGIVLGLVGGLAGIWLTFKISNR